MKNGFSPLFFIVTFGRRARKLKARNQSSSREKFYQQELGRTKELIK